MKLYLCEKPSQAGDIAKALGNARRTGTHWEAAGGLVTWCYGHLVEMLQPEGYDGKYAEWNLADLPIIPRPFRFIPKKAAAAQLRAIGGLLAKCGEVVIATDADREGEMIGREVLEHHGYRGKVSRLWLSALDEESVRKGLARLKDGAETVSLYHAALARSEADWLVGMNMTRALTLKQGRASGVFSVGRVQTPTVALVVRRDRAIAGFKPRDYFEIEGYFTLDGAGAPNPPRVTLTHAPKDGERIWERAEAARRAALADKSPAVLSRKTEDRRKAPPKLFSLSGLQKRANALWGWSADKTLGIAQSLYETHKATSYPRSDCPFMPEELVADIPVITGHLLKLDAFRHLAGLELTPRLKTVFNTAKVTSHYAITPTKTPPPLAAMSADEHKAYQLIAAHYLASLLPDFAYKSTRLETTIQGMVFSATGTTPGAPGWKAAFSADASAPEEDGEGEGGVLPEDFRDGCRCTVDGTKVIGKSTKPPPSYTEGTLIEDMMSVAKFVTDPDKKARLKETSGIGTEATRANIIETIRERNYIEAKGRKIIATPKGITLISLLEAVLPALADPGETAVWEDGLEAIVRGGGTEAFVDGIGGRVREWLGVISSQPGASQPGASQSAGADSGAKVGGVPLLDHGDYYTARGAFTGRVYKDVWGHALTPDELARCVAGETVEITGCKKKDGGDAGPKKIRYNAGRKPWPGIEIVSDAPPAVSTAVASPHKSGGAIQDHGDHYTCPGMESGGKPVRFWKKVAGREITPEELASIIESKAEGVRLDGFISTKTGKHYSAGVRYNGRKKPWPGLELIFD
jgi:DNA topoisomerase-3